ncbi:MAG: sigma-70 family RNA polymerase sigma factor [bacterium]|nr:sigma-70 family RNA polymerase sigma factor [bacterium]
MMDEDSRLMLAFQAGDRQAFEQLFRSYTPRLMAFLLRMVKDRGRAEELTQDVFVRVYQAAERYEPRAKFSTWLFGIAHNLALNDLARAYRKRERPLEDAHSETTADRNPDASEQLEARRMTEALEAAIGELPERQRSALMLRTVQGLGYEEIGTVLGASVSSVKSLLHRAREKLVSQMKEAGR